VIHVHDDQPAGGRAQLLGRLLARALPTTCQHAQRNAVAASRHGDGCAGRGGRCAATRRALRALQSAAPTVSPSGMRNCAMSLLNCSAVMTPATSSGVWAASLRCARWASSGAAVGSMVTRSTAHGGRGRGGQHRARGAALQVQGCKGESNDVPRQRRAAHAFEVRPDGQGGAVRRRAVRQVRARASLSAGAADCVTNEGAHDEAGLHLLPWCDAPAPPAGGPVHATKGCATPSRATARLVRKLLVASGTLVYVLRRVSCSPPEQ
jgi:hypothetical protein